MNERIFPARLYDNRFHGTEFMDRDVLVTLRDEALEITTGSNAPIARWPYEDLLEVSGRLHPDKPLLLISESDFDEIRGENRFQLTVESPEFFHAMVDLAPDVRQNWEKEVRKKESLIGRIFARLRGR